MTTVGLCPHNQSNFPMPKVIRVTVDPSALGLIPVSGSPNVFTNGLSTVRVLDRYLGTIPVPTGFAGYVAMPVTGKAVVGSWNVFTNGRSTHRAGDLVLSEYVSMYGVMPLPDLAAHGSRNVYANGG